MSSTVAGSSNRKPASSAGCDDRVAQAVAIRRAEEEQALRQLVEERLVLGDAIEEVRADREHDAQRARRIVGDGVEARRERRALLRIGDLRVELLELIDEQQDARAMSRRARPRSR